MKASRVASLRGALSAGRPVWTPRDYAALSRAKAFRRTPSCIAAVRLDRARRRRRCRSLLKRATRNSAEHPLLALLARPNPREGGQRFLESLYGHLLVSGNAYVEAVSVDGAPRELLRAAARPHARGAGPDGWPAAYEYTVGAQSVRFAASRRTTRCRRSCI